MSFQCKRSTFLFLQFVVFEVPQPVPQPAKVSQKFGWFGIGTTFDKAYVFWVSFWRWIDWKGQTKFLTFISWFFGPNQVVLASFCLFLTCFGPNDPLTNVKNLVWPFQSIQRPKLTQKTYRFTKVAPKPNESNFWLTFAGSDPGWDPSKTTNRKFQKVLRLHWKDTF